MKKSLFLFIAFASILFSSCSSDYTILESIGSTILTADSSVKTINEDITFTVKDNDGNDLTAEATIYVDGSAIEGNTYTSATVGEFEVTAKYSGITSEPLTVRFHDGSEVIFNRRVLIEDYTGTWCGYCPRVSYGLELLKEQSDNVVAVAIHRATLNTSSDNYDPYTFDSTELENFINVPGYPKGLVNRITQWDYPEPNNLNQVISLTQGDPGLGLAMKTVVEGNNISLDVKVKFSTNHTGLKLVVYVLENGLVYEQTNYTDYYDSEDHIYDFVHDHVLRESFTNLLGDAIDSSNTGQTFTRSFNQSVPTTVEDATKLEFVAFVIDADGNAINVRSAHIGEDQEFEEL
ncbi:MAG: hypothetical protein BM557_02350 [Flavobacterium sp. MedPE-SWcel]|uniref:Omp28-related outer membrane protein n=1 Tax=uncultured Flavobacterium sp. TaxID=165435 RepID=UPI00091E512F|nr:Omp28-related outer membrane protein [uncultured Flavobacterium sp.]OIQ21658.1 MAG: hypothetical protein BM557_02350 [Flavobacterium sp. MedPE-SWcel]